MWQMLNEAPLTDNQNEHKISSTIGTVFHKLNNFQQHTIYHYKDNFKTL